ncbi:MAG TPA: sigma-54-dependent Fis family transcriptional regulator, partial [Candidatus Moranbacteria bacterium]|nr:sigma-54-dependent Fis family transcriptional regulator [Candidatus Moranbacteria bacterium]
HNLLESEMFGYEKGAFTGAAQRKIGKFESANRGTLLLDEVSEMDVQLQAKLLRTIQESEVDRLGGKGPVPVDVRIIATTNSDLKKSLAERTFREDLYYRLNVIPVKIPPLRERKRDIIILSEHFLKKYGSAQKKNKMQYASETLDILQGYSWPGNIRELENVIERAVLISNENNIMPKHLGLEFEGGNSSAKIEEDRAVNSFCSENVTLHEMEKQLIYETLEKVNGNKTRASKILGISVRTMRNKLNEYSMTTS